MTGCGGALPKKSALTVCGTGGATSAATAFGAESGDARAARGDCASARTLGEDLDMEANKVPSRGSSLRICELSPCSKAGTLDEFLDMEAFVRTLGGESSPSGGGSAPTAARAGKARDGSLKATIASTSIVSPSWHIEGALGIVSSLTSEDALPEMEGT